MVFRYVVLFILFFLRVGAEGAATKPTGRFLFQPQWLWANSESTVDGTGFLIEHDGKIYGVTSTEFLNFDLGGVTTATWLDVHSYAPVLTFRYSIGEPERKTIRFRSEIRDDFLLLESPPMRENCVPLQLEFVEHYPPGQRLWFPNKNDQIELGYEWVNATVEQDAGNYIKVRPAEPIVVKTKAGSPILNAETGKVVGVLHRGEEDEGRMTLIFCPARSLVRYLRNPPIPVSLLLSIRR